MKRNKYVSMIILQFAIFFFVVTTSGCYITLSGCLLGVSNETDKRNILFEYTNPGINSDFYTFKAEIREIYIFREENENDRLYYFNVDKEDFESQYGNDEIILDNGVKSWERVYAYFCGCAFYFTDSNYSIVKNGGGSEFLKEGNTVTITANSYDGIIGLDYPILSLKIDGTVYLDFETGLENYLAYVCAGFRET